MTSWLGNIIGAAALLCASVAVACPPPPPPPPQDVGESEDAYAARVAAHQASLDAQHQAWLDQRQVAAWEDADAVFLARIERVRPMELYYWGDVQRVTLRPVREIGPLKGRRYTNRFDLAYQDATTCGPMPSFDAIAGNVGDVFVVFVHDGRPHQNTVLDTIAPANVTEPNVRALLDAAGVE